LEERKDFDGAIADCTKAIELSPELAKAFRLRGNAKRAKGDRFGAIDDLDRALQLEGPLRPKR
jgi:tetratricopeptide (TPR) repeat protein